MPRAARIGALALVTLLGLTFTFWPQISSGFFYFTSDRLDGLIAVSIYEHWYAFLAGATPWDKAFYFHPWPNTMGMNEGFLLNGLAHAAARAAGLPPLLAADIAGMALKAMTAPAVYLIMRRHFSMAVAPALFAALLTLCAGNLMIKGAMHAQFYAVGPALWCGLLILECGAALRGQRPRRAAAMGALAAGLGGGMLITSFYVTYALLIFSGLVLLFDLLLRGVSGQPLLPTGRRWLWALPFIGAAGLVAALPALHLYLPQFRTGQMHSFEAARDLAITPLGLLEPGMSSPLWSWLNAAPAGTPDGPSGYGPLTLVLLALGTLAAVLQIRNPARPAARLVAAFGLAAMFLLLAVTNWWGMWLWEFAWGRLPAASAFRAVSRMSLLITPAVLIVGVWWLAGLSRKFGPTAPAVLAALILAEQFVPHFYGIDRRAEEARLAAVAEPPADCRVFAATRPREGVVTDRLSKIYSHNVDAMITASVLRLPTINGFCTFNPPDWDLADPSSPSYPDRVMAQAERHNLEVCGLDFERLSWSPTGRPFEGVPTPRTALQLTSGQALPVNATVPASRDLLISGWSGLEQTGVWTLGEKARIRLPISPDISAGTLRLEGLGFSRNAPHQTIRLVLPSGTSAQSQVPLQGGGTVTVAFGQGDLRDGLLDLTVEIESPASPAPPNEAGDHRQLGFFLRSILLL